MDVDNVECLSLPDASMDADDVGLALHAHAALLAAAAARAAYPKGGAGAGGAAPASGVHELLECPVCTNSMYPPIHQGYYDFSQKLKHIARLPFATIACGTSLMLLIIVWQPQIEMLSVSALLRYNSSIAYMFSGSGLPCHKQKKL